MTHKKIKDFINEYKDYQILFIFIFTLLGGLTQVFELALISTYYIRFFSITQVISDGLLFVFLLSLISLVAYLFYPFLIILDKTEINKGVTPIQRIRNVTISGLSKFFILFTLILLITGGILLFSQPAKALLSHLWILIISCAILTIYFVLYFRIASYINGKPSKSKDLSRNTIFKKIKGNRLIVVLCSFFIVILFYMYKATLTQPKGFTNNKYIKCFIQEKYPDTKYEIRYFNDKYIFIVIKNIDKNELTNEETLVLKFDKLFDYNACN
ncbi:hypothetical protein Celal_3606 [Cellulophaga algicola DSM 14237]|uniref:Uncharacterized protein n=1 Tax=Cellulophaga algicola (strain DSM 14237 / IC166 / ACAM 630) TaxID=688270 RepID=E6X952_CELAD|nr:hypothetical protein [Cellulophaga algicola]ADV50862.1 hypothetical protein Celal_3606 [Cellulophaga algicola DSM 14237]